MVFKGIYFQRLVALVIVCTASLAQAQIYGTDNEWMESEVPPPPAVDVKKLVTFEVPTSLSLVYGVDPASISISKSDGLVRYVVVATSASGARNVMYEALRCSTGEFKTYARYSSDDKWSAVSNAQWRSVFENMPSRHPLWLAKAGACDAGAPVGSVKELIAKLKSTANRLGS